MIDPTQRFHTADATFVMDQCASALRRRSCVMSIDRPVVLLVDDDEAVLGAGALGGTAARPGVGAVLETLSGPNLVETVRDLLHGHA
jgi:hypothetical protein